MSIIVLFISFFVAIGGPLGIALGSLAEDQKAVSDSQSLGLAGFFGVIAGIIGVPSSAAAKRNSFGASFAMLLSALLLLISGATMIYTTQLGFGIVMLIASVFSFVGWKINKTY